MVVNNPLEFKAKSEEQKIRDNLSKIGSIIMVMSGKGGVGKSTVAANLAVALSTMGKGVGLVDVDIHGPNIPKMMGLEGKNLLGDDTGIIPIDGPGGVKVISLAFLLEDPDSAVIWRGPLKIKAIKQFLGDVHWNELDYLIIDLPPGTGDEPLTIAQLLPNKAKAIVVTTPQDVALLDSRKAVNFAKKMELDVMGIVENMSILICPHCGGEIELFKVGGGEKAAKELKVPFLGRIPLEPDVVVSGDEGKPIVIKSPDSRSAKAFRDIAVSL